MKISFLKVRWLVTRTASHYFPQNIQERYGNLMHSKAPQYQTVKNMIGSDNIRVAIKAYRTLFRGEISFPKIKSRVCNKQHFVYICGDNISRQPRVLCVHMQRLLTSGAQTSRQCQEVVLCALETFWILKRFFQIILKLAISRLFEISLNFIVA